MSYTTGDAIGDMLGSAVSEIAGRFKQAFVVGNGLSKEGTRLLGKKLACMTIGDLESLLDLKNIDPVKVAELMKNIGDLAKALVSLCKGISNMTISLRQSCFYMYRYCRLFQKVVVNVVLSLSTYSLYLQSSN